METQLSNVFEYITSEENNYRTEFIPLTDNWDFNMYEHLKKSFLYKHSKFYKGANDDKRYFNNIIRPILNVAYRSEGFDVKDIVPYVDESENYYKSLFVRKYHPLWAKTYGIDARIDESVQSYVDYGLTLVENVDDVAPRVVDLQSLAFCDQTDILAGPICEKMFFSPDQLQEMVGKFDADAVDKAIALCLSEKEVSSANDKTAKTPGKYVEVYKLRGVLPEKWLKDNSDGDTSNSKYVRQVHFVCFYNDGEQGRQGITLYKGKEKKNPYKALKRDPIFGRACGFGGVEELFEHQTWTNYSEIHIQKMLKAASLMVLQTADESYKTRQKITDLEKNEVLYHADGKPLSQVSIQPQNIGDFREQSALTEQRARTMGSASDPQLGLNPVSGTPLGTTEIVTNQGVGIHDYRRGQLAAFWEEIYREWVLPHMVTEINRGQRFLEELTLDELQFVSEALVDNLADKTAKKVILSGGKVTKQDEVVFKEIAHEKFRKGGNKHFLEVLKDDIKDLPVAVKINVAGKQKDLARNVDKLSRVFQLILTAQDPQRLQMLSKTFNDILEQSELSPIDFQQFTRMTPEVAPPTTPAPNQVINQPALATA